MNEKRPIAFSLSLEEILIALGFLGAKEMIGLDNEYLRGLGERETRLISESGLRALVARGFVGYKAGKFELKPSVEVIVRACAFSEETIIIDNQRSSSVFERYIFHKGQGIQVIHTVPITAVHQFIVMREKSRILNAILTITAMKDRQAPDHLEFKIRGDLFDGAINARENDTQVLEYLCQAGLDDALVSALAREFSGRRQYTTFNHLPISDNDPRKQGFSLMQSPKNLWLFRAVPAPDRQDHPRWMAGKTISTKDAESVIEALLDLD